MFSASLRSDGLSVSNSWRCSRASEGRAAPLACYVLRVIPGSLEITILPRPLLTMLSFTKRIGSYTTSSLRKRPV